MSGYRQYVLMTTTDGVPGRTIAACCGLVVACIPFWGSKYAEGIANLKGVKNEDVPAAYEARRTELLTRLIGKAVDLGADAVVGVRMTDREITSSWKELCAYGTAVTFER